MSNMKLVEFEYSSALWMKLRTHLEERLQMLREKNDGSLDADATARLRGQIFEVKTMLELGKPAPAIINSD